MVIFMSLFKEFKEFAFKGNVIDLAVAVIIGGAFGKIVSSLVNDIIMPVVGLFLGGHDIKSLYYALDGNTYESLEAAQEAGAAVLTYGNFIQTIVDFLIIAVCIFAMIKIFMSLKKKEEVAEEPKADPRLCPFCKTEIHEEATRCPHCTSEIGLPEKKD